MNQAPKDEARMDDVDCGLLDESDLTPLGRVADRVAAMTLDELAQAALTDPEVQAAITWVSDEARRPARDHGCTGPGYC